jgi:hypothetical protein
MLDAFVGSGATAAKGLVPAPSTTAGTSSFLREDGSWQIPNSMDLLYNDMDISDTSLYTTGRLTVLATTGTAPATSTANAQLPTGANVYGAVYTQKISRTRIQQIYYTKNDGQAWLRSYGDGSTWSSWVPLAVTMSGDATQSLTGAVTIANSAVTTAKVADNSITGAKIALGADAQGDIMYYNGTDWVRLAKGTAGQVLTMNGGATAPSWAASSGGGGSSLYDSTTIDDGNWSGNTDYTKTITVTGAAVGNIVTVSVSADLYEAALSNSTNLILHGYVTSANTVKIWARVGAWTTIPVNAKYYVVVHQ